MRVLCTGPMNSGTRLLTRIVATGRGVEAVHRSRPFHGEWWDIAELLAVVDRVVVIVRRPDASTRAVATSTGRASDVAAAEWQQAIDELARIPGAYWVSYEALCAEPVVQVESLSRWLGVHLHVPEHIESQNHKWLGSVPPQMAALSPLGAA